jgi:hypothetical protein
MKSRFYILQAVLCLLSQFSYSQTLPEGWILQYQQAFNDEKSLADFKFDHPDTWGIFKNKTNYYLQCGHAGDDSIPDAIPGNRAILNNKTFGDFIFEANVMTAADSSQSQEICLFLGVKDSTRYYFIRLSDAADSSVQGVYLVKKSHTRRLTYAPMNPVNLQNGKLHKIRMQHDIVKRTIKVFVDDMSQPAIQTKDYELVMGMVGIGSFSSPARFDNIKIWAPTVITEE